MNRAPERLMERLFGADLAEPYHDRFAFHPGGAFVETAAGYILLEGSDSAHGTPVTLKVCDVSRLAGGARDLAKSLWQSDARAVTDLTYRGEHGGRALAEFVASGWDERSKTLFAAWERTHSLTLADFLANPDEAPLQLDHIRKLELAMGLLQALEALHGRGIIHRELGPTAIGLQADHPARMTMLHFGMSFCLMRGAPDPSTHEGESTAYPALAYAAPERLGLLFEAGEIVEPADDFPQDLFSLGLVLTEWFTYPFEGTGLASFLAPRTGYQPYAHLDWVMSEVLDRVSSIRVPRDRVGEDALKQFLMRMTDFSPDMRFSGAGQALRASRRVLGILRDRVVRASTERPLRVVVAPVLCAKGLDAIRPRENPRARLGRAEQEKAILAELSEDLGGGYTRIALHRHDSERYALDAYGKRRWYLRGRHNLYRLELFRNRRDGGLERPWLAYLHQVVRGGVAVNDLGRVPAAIEVVALNDPDVSTYGSMSHPPAELGRWDEVVPYLAERKAATRSADNSASPIGIVAALREALAISQAWPDANTYAVDLVSSADRATQDGADTLLTLKYAPERDATFAEARPFLEAFAETSGARLGFDAWVQECAADLPCPVELISADRGAPRRALVGELRGVAIESAGLQVALADSKTRVPEQAFIRTAADGAETLRRQRRALGQLERSPHRIAALTNPALVQRRVAPPDVPKQIGIDLDPNKESLIRAAFSSQPAFYLQGPPGTGKTTLATEFIGRVLAGDERGRVLISAQANDALDNLMGEVLDRLPLSDPTSVVRIRSGNHQPARADILERQSDSLLSAFCADTLALSKAGVQGLAESDPPQAQRLRSLIGPWWKLLKEQHRDAERVLFQSANLIFATCLGAGSLARHDLREFDWVIVEEAARAHPTEMLIPLLQGHRWLVIGDHLQLEPFNADEHREVFRARALKRASLRAQASRRGPGVAARSRSAEAEDFLTLFGYLFEHAAPSQRGTLTTCYRMNPTICSLIDRLFYRGGGEREPVLVPKFSATERSHPYRARWADPDWLVGRSVVWIDTAYHPRRREQPRAETETSRENLFEVELIGELAKRLREQDTELSLALLSTYLRQRDHLLELSQTLENTRAMTVAASQGKEADVVILSLVRSNDMRNPGEALGRVRRDSELNVALSRARRLLIIVGDVGHFERFGKAAGGLYELIRLMRAWPETDELPSVCIHVPGDLIDRGEPDNEGHGLS